jgi:hypothetical protein
MALYATYSFSTCLSLRYECDSSGLDDVLMNRIQASRQLGGCTPLPGMEERVIRRAALVTVRRAICERFPPGAERRAWLAWALRLRGRDCAPPVTGAS